MNDVSLVFVMAFAFSVGMGCGYLAAMENSDRSLELEQLRRDCAKYTETDWSFRYCVEGPDDE